MITISNLSKSFAGKPALRQVSLQVNRGETLVLLGHSGSGKSTLLRCLLGLTRFDSGEIQVDGVNMRADMPAAERRAAVAQIRTRCGFVFQQYHLFPHLTVEENLSLAPVHVGRVDKAAARSRSAELLRSVGLEHKLNNRPHQLSGGEQQRVAVARALAMQPEYLLYDEPTSALDSQRAGEMWKLMAALAAAGQTQIIVTHQEQIQGALPCRVVRMADGKIVPTKVV
jgi:polar amino acid transport system ATP-binding protein